MQTLNIKYFITAKLDKLSQFMKCNMPRLVMFAWFLVFGAVRGVLSSLKPIDPLQSLSDVNSGMFGLISQAAYAGYIFPLLAFTLLAIAVFCFVGRYAYSTILTCSFTVAMGFFQGATAILVIRSYGILSLPLVIAYVIFSVLTDMLLFALFAVLAEVSAEKRKYGCSTSFLIVLKRAAVTAVICAVFTLLKGVSLILFSFFL